MPPRKSSPQPPVMTWARATPALVVSVVVDALRLFFEWFWLFGPAVAGLYCGAKTDSTVLAATCTTVVGALGIAAGAATLAFGAIMAIVIGFAGWFLIGIILLISNPRIFKDSILPFALSLLVSEVPLIGSIPAVTIGVWRMYHRQIKSDKEALAAWNKENADADLREQQMAQMQLMQMQAAEQERQFTQEEMAQQEAANDEQFDAEETPNELSEAA